MYLLFPSCATNIQLQKSHLLQNLNLDKDFTIEGKFKIEINNLNQSGYFTVNKTKDTVKIRIGKNYLLPDKEFTYDIYDYLPISEIGNSINLPLNEKIVTEKLNIKYFLEAMLGKRITKKDKKWEIIYSDKYFISEGHDVPQKIKFKSESINLELILQKAIRK